MSVWLPAAQQLSECERRDHYFLDPADQCWFLATYRAGNRQNYLNGLIADFKSAPSAAARSRVCLRRKRRAIHEIAQAMRAAIARNFVEASTWVPIPPSVIASDPDYDQRLASTLARAFSGYDLDVREVLIQVRSAPADHCSRRRSSCEALSKLIELCSDPLLRRAPRERLVLFDDLLTTGKHYKCCEQQLRAALPRAAICGLFVARRVLSRRQRGEQGPPGL